MSIIAYSAIANRYVGFAAHDRPNQGADVAAVILVVSVRIDDDVRSFAQRAV